MVVGAWEGNGAVRVAPGATEPEHGDLAIAGVCARIAREWPFRGREGEVDAVLHVMEGGPAAAAVIRGPEGVGRSRLVTEIAARARSAGWIVRAASGTPSASTIPLGALATILPHPEGRAFEPVEVLRWTLRALSDEHEGRTLLLVDDAHLLDNLSRLLLEHIAAASAAFVLLTASAEAAASAPCPTLPGSHLLSLEPLDGAVVRQLVGDVLGGRIEEGTLDELVRLASGNLSDLRDILESGVRGGTLARVGERWRRTGPHAASPSLVERVLARLGALDGEERAFLEELALAEPLAVGVAERLLDPSGLVSLEGRRVVATDLDGSRSHVRLRRPADGLVLRASLPTLRRRAAHRRLAAALEAMGARREQDVRVRARWRLEGHGAAAADLLLRAGEAALDGRDYRDAERMARAALRAGPAFDPAFLLGRSLMAQGRVEEAEEVFLGLETVALSPSQVATLATTRAANLVTRLSRTGEATGVLQMAESAVTAPQDRASLLATRALLLHASGRPAAALDAVSTLTGSSAGPRARAQALAVSAAVRALSGQPETALDEARRALAAQHSGRLRSRPDEATITGLGWDALWYAGRLDEAESLAQQDLLHSYAVDCRHHRAHALFQLGLCARARGRALLAMDRLGEAAVVCEELDLHLLTGCMAALAEAAALAGRTDRAAAALGAAERARVLAYDLPRIERSRAWIVAAQGNVAEARRHALASADLSAAHGFATLEAIALHDAVRLGSARAVSRRLRAVAHHTEGALFPAMADHGMAVATEDGESLDDVSRRFEAMGYVLLAAEAAAQAARLHRARHAAAAARRSNARARLLASTCDTAWTVGVDPPGKRCTLSPREREVATMAATGLTSRAIAERLEISVRTVDHLLQRAYAKLEIRGRRELGELFGCPAGLGGAPAVPSRV